MPTTPPLLDARTRAELMPAPRRRKRRVEAGAGRRSAGRRRSGSTPMPQRQRVEQLAKQGVTSLDELDAARSNAQALAEQRGRRRRDASAAHHELEAARAALARAQRLARRTAGRSTSARRSTGVVLQRLHESEAVVPAGEPLIEIADPADLEIVAGLSLDRRGADPRRDAASWSIAGAAAGRCTAA